MADEATIPATQAYPATLPEASPAAGAPEEPPKKKRGKPKDELAPPKPKNPYQRITGEARSKIKEDKPELATDLKAMGLALKEVWDNTPEETKQKMQQVFEEEMKVWKPKWEEYKKTQHYKEFFEIKQDWIDARQRKKLVKKLNKDAPKRPKSGYMLYAGEIRERVQKEVQEAGGGMGDVGKKISEEWGAVSEERKAELAKQSAEMKKQFDIDFAAYKKSEDWGKFCTEKAKMESKQLQKKLMRTKLDEAPKKAPSGYALFRSEVMPKVTEENKGLGCGELGKKIAQMWVEVPLDKKEEYQAAAAKLKIKYDEDLLAFKRKQKYTEYLLERQMVKAKENKLLGLRELPKRPPNAFSMYALTHKSEVEPGKGEGKGRDALMKLYMKADEKEKAELKEKEAEAKIQWMNDTQAFKESQKFLEFKKTEQKIKMEFMTEASKVLTLRFLSEAPKEPPKSPFAVYVAEKRKAAGEADGAPKSKKEKFEELSKFKQEWLQADLQTKHNCDVKRKESMAKWKDDVKEFMDNDTWKGYVAECKKLKVPMQSILREKKKVLRKLKNGMSILPLPSKPESFPVRPPSAVKAFFKDKLGEIKDREELPKLWQALDEEGKQKYQSEAEEKFKAYRAELNEFQTSEEGKTYIREVKLIARRNRLAKAKDQYLADMPKKPPSALTNFVKKYAKTLKIKNPDVKGADFKKILMDKWANLDEAEKNGMVEDANSKKEEYEKSIDEFKKSENWSKFRRTMSVKAKKKPKAKAKGGPNIPKPKKPEALPQKPLDAFKTYCKDMAGAGRSLGDLMKMFKELPEEDRGDRQKQASERMVEWQEKTDEFNKTPEGKKYAHACATYIKRTRLAMAKTRFMKNEPKRPQTAFLLFSSEKRADISRDFPDIKGLGPVQQKLSSMWTELGEEEKAEWSKKEAEAKEEYEKAMEEFQKSPDYRKYQAIVSRLCKKPGAKKAAKKTGPALPPVPSNLPKKPATGFFLFLSDQKSTGNPAGIAQATVAWRNLGAEGQKKFVDEAAAKQVQYDKDMKEFTKSADGKKYLRLKAAAEKKNRLMLARKKFLGSDDAPKEPKRPASAYFIFVQKTRPQLAPGKISDVAKQLTERWSSLTPEEKKVFEEEADELKKEYEKQMAEYKNSANFKKYDKAIKNINKKKGVKAKGGGKGAAGAKGRKAGAGGGRGGAGAAAPAKPAANSDSDSDVMGSDEDNSSSSDSDSD